LKVSITRSWVNSFVAIRTKSSKRKVPVKNSSVCQYPECSWREQNSPGSERTRPVVCGWTDVQSKRSWHFGLGRPQDEREESYRIEDDVWSDDTSWNISNRETYFGDCLHLCCRRVTHSLNNHIASPNVGPGADQEGECSIQYGFCLELESQALH
jgi:hypothetical protein